MAGGGVFSADEMEHRYGAAANGDDPASSDGGEPFGVYIHIPFCASKCDYCAFATWTDRHHLAGRYLAALRTDIARAVAAGQPEAASVFVGGGTPTLVDPHGLAEVIAAVPRSGDAEVTVECNPDDVTTDLLSVFRDAGVNRISLGVQSMSEHVLAALGRRHDPSNVTTAVEAIHETGFTTFNLDVIYGAAGETLDDWRHTIERVVELAPPHVSAYALTVEPGTPLATDLSRHPDDDDQADKYELTDDMLSIAGLRNYEVSNWAAAGHECRHNLLYWRQQDYKGFGCAAHSHTSGRRWWNVRTPDRYIEAVEAGASTEAAGETLDPDTRHLEALQLALRTSDGVPVDAFEPATAANLDGLIVRSGDRWQLTRAGRLVANEVSMRLR